MSKCFIIQPFDKGAYDKRYEDVFVPAIGAAGLEPYRVDRDPGVTIPIEDIGKGIVSAAVCLAEISTDNPNVWFELGYAIASQREVVLVCSNERVSRHYPFDIQHRSIISYKTESKRDFEELQSNITKKLKALLQKKVQSQKVIEPKSPEFNSEELNYNEIAILKAVAEDDEEINPNVSLYQVNQKMEKNGFEKIAITLGLQTLINKGMIMSHKEPDFSGPFKAYSVTDTGRTWLLENYSGQKSKGLEQDNEETDDEPF